MKYLLVALWTTCLFLHPLAQAETGQADRTQMDGTQIESRLIKSRLVENTGVNSAHPDTAQASCVDAAVPLQQRWDQITYVLTEKDREAAYASLIEQTRSASEAQPQCAQLWIWDGIARSTYAGAAGGLGALKSIRDAKKSLEKAIALDDTALAGAARTSLGSLYYQAPGWPLSFGNKKLAEQNLLLALGIAPDDIDANYFYGDYLFTQKKYPQAQTALNKALAAPPRPDRPLADQGRRDEILRLLDKVAAKL